MKRLFVLLSVPLIILLVISLVISCAPKPKEAVILRLVVPPPPGDWLTDKDIAMAERFNERADGEYVIQVFPGESLVKIPEYLDAVRTGAVEMSDVAWGIYAGLDPRLGAYEIPFLFNNIRASGAAQEASVELVDPVYQEKFNQKVLASLTTGSMEMFSTKPVKTMDDWEGLLVGAINPQLAAMTEAIGGAPVTVVWTDLYSNLEKGVIDAALNSTQGSIMWRLTDVCSYVTLFNGSFGQNAYNINLDVWEAMPKRTQDILLEEVKAAAEFGNDEFVRLSDEDVETLTAMGVDVYFLPKAERDKWYEACRPYIEGQLSGLGDFGGEIKQIADEANSQFP